MKINPLYVVISLPVKYQQMNNRAYQEIKNMRCYLNHICDVYHTLMFTKTKAEQRKVAHL
jgi:hypothetical protein